MRSGRGLRRAGLAANAGVAVLSVVITYLVLEFVVFTRVLPYVPLDRQIDLHEGIRTLAQSSKAGTLPHDYVAILGDSYAQGSGDWYLAVDKKRNPPYNVTHLVYERTGRDAITFGASGAGSLRGIVAEPVTQLEFMRATRRFSVSPPDVFIIYFYEGNDLDDNVRDVAARYDGPDCRPGEPFDADAFASFIDDTVIGKDPLHVEAERFHWYDDLFVADFIYRMVRRNVGYIVHGKAAYEPPPPEWHEGPIDRAVVGGRDVDIPDVLQGPSLELTPAELDLGVDVFEQALLCLGRRYPDRPIGVLYVPSPLSSYEISSPTVSCQTYHGRSGIYPASLVRERSDEIAARIRGVTERAGFQFADARGRIRAETATRFLHGPLDWRHLNRDGQEVLADEVLALTARCEAAGRNQETAE